MKFYTLTTAAILVAGSLMACEEQPVPRVHVPGPGEPQAYQPVPYQKPLPPEGYAPGAMPAQGQMPPGGSAAPPQ